MRRVPVAAVVVMAAAALLHDGLARADEGQYPQGLMATTPGATKGCTIEARALGFGTYDTGDSRPLYGQGQVIYTCGVQNTAPSSIATPVKNIRIEISTGAAGSYDRRMSSASERLLYNVYLDADYRRVWGDGSGGTDYYFDPSPPNRQPITVTVFGRVPAMQDVGVGQYSDLLQVKVLF